MFNKIKKILGLSYESYQKKIPPDLNIRFNKEIPLESMREIVRLSSIVKEVNSWEENLKKQPDSFFKQRTAEFVRIIQDRLSKVPLDSRERFVNTVLDEFLPEAFAMVREAARRTIGMRHFDVQILGGIALHKGNIAEMATGEGKTLVATLPAYLNALVKKGVHIVTVNDYLAGRDRDWMCPVYEFLGLSVGVVQSDMSFEERKYAYSCDITYGTNNEFGFDYLRDNMAVSLDQLVQREHFFAIVDEVDSILIDEARTPLIISGPVEETTDKYYIAEKLARRLKGRRILEKDEIDAKYKGVDLEKGTDYLCDEKNQSVTLTDEGLKKCEEMLGIKDLYEDIYTEWPHHIRQALRAKEFFRRDKDYIVKEGKVIIVDEFTGRLMPGRRWSDGLHQAIEAKEGLKIQQESQTLATITLQNYFKMYTKLAGMTGTAYTEAVEFRHIYKLGVVVMPTNKPLQRQNHPDQIYKTKRMKFEAVVREIEKMYRKKRPVLVGTTSIENSEELSFLLKRKGIPHNVLNAKHHEREAYIVAQAGRLGQVTIATNMAGRGTDIILGGNVDFMLKSLLLGKKVSPEEYRRLVDKYRKQFEQEHRQVVELGGLHIIGTERHEARRIDNQLRGRAGRQGDPGSSRFYISLEDDLMRLFGSERLVFIMEKLNFPEDEPIEHYMVNRSIEIAQRRVESHNFEIRKHLLEYDDVMNKQRTVIYSKRRAVLEGDIDKEEILEMCYSVLEKFVDVNFSSELPYDAQVANLLEWFRHKFRRNLAAERIRQLPLESLKEYLKEEANNAYSQKEQELGADFKYLQQMVYLQVIDSRWKDHLRALDEMKEGIQLYAHAQRNPLVEYQHKAYEYFVSMMDSVKEAVVDIMFKIEARSEPRIQARSVFSGEKKFQHSEYSFSQKGSGQTKGKVSPRPIVKGKKIGRNDPCPCGSGKKYKKCCGRNK